MAVKSKYEKYVVRAPTRIQGKDELIWTTVRNSMTIPPFSFLLGDKPIKEAHALLEKTFIRSPVSGVVLRKQRRAGESVSDKDDTPLVTLADDSRLRVRVEVDETDVAKVRVGQRACVTAAAYGDRKFLGRVIRVGQVLGRKNVRTEEPAERVDTKILETLVELDPGQRLPLGLRVDTFLEVTP